MNARTLPDTRTQSISPAKLAHVVLRVSDLPRSRDCYLRVLQARPAFENEMVCFLTYDDEHHRIGLIARPGLGSQADAQTGLEHVAFTYGSLAELLATYRRLAADRTGRSTTAPRSRCTTRTRTATGWNCSTTCSPPRRRSTPSSRAVPTARTSSA